MLTLAGISNVGLGPIGEGLLNFVRQRRFLAEWSNGNWPESQYPSDFPAPFAATNETRACVGDAKGPLEAARLSFRHNLGLYFVLAKNDLLSDLSIDDVSHRH
jgi:hypothetical protein